MTKKTNLLKMNRRENKKDKFRMEEKRNLNTGNTKKTRRASTKKIRNTRKTRKTKRRRKRLIKLKIKH